MDMGRAPGKAGTGHGVGFLSLSASKLCGDSRIWNGSDTGSQGIEYIQAECSPWDR
jgi:hypothetical protein